MFLSIVSEKNLRLGIRKMDKYAVMDMIGEGSFGRVFRGKDKQTGEIVALKLIPKVGHSDKDIQSLRSECKIQKELNHPNIVRMIDAFETDNEVISVAEFVPGELFRLFDQYKAGKLKSIINLSKMMFPYHRNCWSEEAAGAQSAGDCRGPGVSSALPPQQQGPPQGH